MNRNTALRGLLLLAAIAHLTLGLIAYFAPAETLQQVAALTYGASVDLSASTHHVIRMLGAFMLGVGFMALWAWRAPERHPAVITGIIVILALRVVQRVIFAQEIQTTFNISPSRLWLQAGFFLLLAGALFWLRPKAGTSAIP